MSHANIIIKFCKKLFERFEVLPKRIHIRKNSAADEFNPIRIILSACGECN